MAARGVWVAYHYDWSGFSIHSSEKAALRVAVANTQQVMFWPFGLDRSSAERADAERKAES